MNAPTSEGPGRSVMNAECVLHIRLPLLDSSSPSSKVFFYLSSQAVSIFSGENSAGSNLLY